MNDSDGIRKSFIIAADVPDAITLRNLAIALKGFDEISGFKLCSLGLRSLDEMARIIRSNFKKDIPIICEQPIAYSDKNAANFFVRILKETRIGQAILYPFSGPADQESWIKACQRGEINVIVGSIIANSNFFSSQGGYMENDALEKILSLGLSLGVKDYVLPADDYWLNRYWRFFNDRGGIKELNFYIQRFSNLTKDVARIDGIFKGKAWRAIIGPEIYGLNKINTIYEMREAAETVFKTINKGV